MVLTRVFDAPRELVFDAWTDPEHVVRWWGQHGFSITIHEMDVWPGGVWRFAIHAPDGIGHTNRVTFLEVARPSHLVYQHSLEGVSDTKAFRVSVNFDQENGKTPLTVRMMSG